MYYKDFLDYKPKVRKEKIYEFCEKHLKEHSRDRDFRLINTALRKGGDKNQKLIEIESVNINLEELSYIDSLDISYNAKKVVFTFLVNYKLNKQIYEFKNDKEYTSIYFQGGTVKYKDLKERSNLPNKIDINADIIRELSLNKIIIIKHKGLIALNFIKDILKLKQSDDNIIHIFDFENIGWAYDLQHGDKKIRECKICKTLFKFKTNNQLYCGEECYNISNRENMKSKYEKVKIFVSEKPCNTDK